MTQVIVDISRERLNKIEAVWNANGRIEQGEISFLIRLAKAYLDGAAGNAHRERLLALRTRQNTQASEAWAKAAEQALAGDPRALHDRLRLHQKSASTDAKVVQSEEQEGAA
ncbi:hypothetical protein [Methylobacterium radiotolerans]|uniref:hypothetical protein n=1 Tax=Methylobacterium radiotolerans TaxID=31998 RepID=UPI000D5EB9F6|nr:MULTISPECIES: hypothetical protein [Methylobacterium]MDE3749456.1 hypothetical protein [Methylobacterium radiotolerans]PVY97871.1 hypothetical protein C7388_112124 [Methylobacterium organophilum]